MKLIGTVLLVFITLFASAQVSGLYRHINEGGYSSITICLNQDGTYKYVNSQHLADFSEEGRYTILRDTIILNSDYQLEDLIKVKQSVINAGDSVYISIVTHSKFPLFTLVINDSLEFDIWQNNSYLNGLLTFKAGFVNTIQIKSGGHVNYEITRLKIEPGNNNLIELFINDLFDINTSITKNEKWLYRKTGLVFATDPKLVLDYVVGAKCK